jgi:hypothetical protein
MAILKQATVLRHKANTGEGVAEVAFAAGEEVTVLKEWQEHYLVKNAAGQLFNVPKQLVER